MPIPRSPNNDTFRNLRYVENTQIIWGVTQVRIPTSYEKRENLILIVKLKSIT